MRNLDLSYSEARAESLEESLSSMTMEYQCEIESTQLESISLQQNLFETTKLLEEKAQENSRLNKLIQDLKIRNLDANKVIEILVKENEDLKDKLQSSDINNEEQFHESSFSKVEKDIRTNGTLLGPLLSKLAIPRASDADMCNKMADMSHQIDEYERVVRQLKEELREEKLKAKEEAEDLAQEMAELRYQLTLMLEAECKRRANVEQISLHRIAELEAQIAEERQKSISSQDLVVRNQ